MSVEELFDRYNNVFYKINSEYVSAQLCGVAAPIFKEIRFTTSDGSFVLYKYSCRTKFLWFAPKIEYQHFCGGSNATNYIWNFFYFNLEKGEFDFENSRLIYKKEEAKLCKNLRLGEAIKLLENVEQITYNDEVYDSKEMV